MAERVLPAEHLALEWEAFVVLGSERLPGFGATPIPWSAMHRYGQSLGLTGGELKRFEDLIFAMDQEWLEWQHERAQRQESETQ